MNPVGIVTWGKAVHRTSKGESGAMDEGCPRGNKGVRREKGKEDKAAKRYTGQTQKNKRGYYACWKYQHIIELFNRKIVG